MESLCRRRVRPGISFYYYFNKCSSSVDRDCVRACARAHACVLHIYWVRENVSARACYIHLSVVFHVSRAEEVELLVFCGAFLTSEPSSLSCSFNTNNQNILNFSLPFLISPLRKHNIAFVHILMTSLAMFLPLSGKF